jgi:hypothetical protein
MHHAGHHKGHHRTKTASTDSEGVDRQAQVGASESIDTPERTDTEVAPSLGEKVENPDADADAEPVGVSDGSPLKIDVPLVPGGNAGGTDEAAAAVDEAAPATDDAPAAGSNDEPAVASTDAPEPPSNSKPAAGENDAPEEGITDATSNDESETADENTGAQTKPVVTTFGELGGRDSKRPAGGNKTPETESIDSDQHHGRNALEILRASRLKMHTKVTTDGNDPAESKPPAPAAVANEATPSVAVPMDDDDGTIGGGANIAVWLTLFCACGIGLGLFRRKIFTSGGPRTGKRYERQGP